MAVPKAERERRRDPEAAILGDVALGHIVQVAHQVQAERRAGAELRQRLIDVERGAPREIGAEVADSPRNRTYPSPASCWPDSTTPPVEPRPNVTDDGPCSTSTSCTLNGSR